MLSTLSPTLSNPKTPFAGAGVRKKQQRVACDRCRGQKLRCVRDNIRGACNRCQRAGTACVTDPTIRISRRPGRPGKNERNINASKDETKKSRHRSLEKSTPTSYNMSSSEGSTTNGRASIKLVPTNNCVDSASVPIQRSVPMEFDTPGAVFDSMSFQITQSSDYLDSPMELWPAYPNAFHFEMNGLRNGCSPHSMQGSGRLVKAPVSSHEPITAMFYQRDITVFTSCSNVSYIHDPIAKVSSLNLELQHQLNIARSISTEHRDRNASSYKLHTMESMLPSPVAFMVQSLQTFHDLLVRVLGPLDAMAAYNAVRHKQIYDTDQASLWRWGNNFSESTDHSEGLNAFSEDLLLDSWKMQLDLGFGDVGFVFDIQDGTSNQEHLDASSSFLVVSCYINLIRFCQAVFVSIRGTLDSDSQQTRLSNIPSLNFSGLSVTQDEQLQTAGLIQRVIRVFDDIESMLGIPRDSEARRAYVRLKKAVLPHVLELVQAQEGIGECAIGEGGTTGLRDEMRKLNAVVYRHV